MLYYTILYYTILYYPMLHYTILSHTIQYTMVCHQPSSSLPAPVCKTPLLYNLTADPGQINDVADKHYDVVRDVMHVMKSQHAPGVLC